ncbi:MAG: hypothetical protein JO140_03960, partial [Candidatus Eremiobacteraeota bacterium]|nr:hypothetical protein [Candidatus Eremiobacteraeota bacterium]
MIACVPPGDDVEPPVALGAGEGVAEPEYASFSQLLADIAVFAVKTPPLVFPWANTDVHVPAPSAGAEQFAPGAGMLVTLDVAVAVA